MTASEVINQIKALPPQDKAQVFDYVHQAEVEQSQQVNYADDASFKAAAERAVKNNQKLLKKLSQ